LRSRPWFFFCGSTPFGLQALGHPQIFIGDVHVGGASGLFELEAAGSLDPLLQSTLAT
jgi:hypothetical protein